MNLWSPDLYNRAWNFAAEAHARQKVPGKKVPYLTHVGSVAMEVTTALARTAEPLDANLAVVCALLHDVVEDTTVDGERLREAFGSAVAEGVEALTKDESLSTKEAQMADSLDRLRRQPREVQMVKLADRIANLQPPPPHWTLARIRAYRTEARMILEALGSANTVLAKRLQVKIQEYGAHCGDLG